MRPSRTRAERNNPVLYIGENELKKELESQAKLKRNERLLEKIKEKNEIIEHYENFKMAGDNPNEDLNQFVNQKKEEIQQEQRMFNTINQAAQIIPRSQNTNSEVERQKRLKLRDEERKRRLQGAKESVYDNPNNQLANVLMTNTYVNHKEDGPFQRNQDNKTRVKEDLYGEPNSNENAKNFFTEEPQNIIETYLEKTKSFENNHNYLPNQITNNYQNQNSFDEFEKQQNQFIRNQRVQDFYANSNEIAELKETVKKSIDQILRQTSSLQDGQHNPPPNNSINKNQMSKTANENVGFMLPSMKAEGKRDLQKLQMKRDLEEQIREKEESRRSQRSRKEISTQPSYNSNQDQMQYLPSNNQNFQNSMQTLENVNQGNKQFDEFWPSHQSPVIDAQLEKKKQYQQDLLNQIEEKKRAKTVQDKYRRAPTSDPMPSEPHYQTTTNFQFQNEPEQSADQKKREYAESLRKQMEEKKEKEKREKLEAERLEYEEEMKIRKEIENTSRKNTIVPTNFHSQNQISKQETNPKSKIKAELFDLQNLDFNQPQLQFHDFGEVIKPQPLVTKFANPDTIETKKNNFHFQENYNESSRQLRTEEDEIINGYANDVEVHRKHNNFIRNSRNFTSNEKMSALYESSINCRILLDELKAERKKMEKASVDQVNAVEDLIRNIMNEKECLEFEICSLRAKMDVNKVETGIGLDKPTFHENRQNDGNQILPSKSDYILYPESEDMLKQSYLRQLQDYNNFAQNFTEAKEIQTEIISPKKPNSQFRINQLKASKGIQIDKNIGSIQSSFGEDHAFVESNSRPSTTKADPTSSSNYRSTLNKFKESNFEPIPENEEYKDLSKRENSESIMISESKIERSFNSIAKGNSQLSLISNKKMNKPKGNSNQNQTKNYGNSSIGVNPLDSEINNISGIIQQKQNRSIHIKSLPTQKEEKNEFENFDKSLGNEDSMDAFSESIVHSRIHNENRILRTFPIMASDMEPRPELKNLDQKTLSQRIDELVPKDLAAKLIDTNDYSYLWKKRHKFTDSISGSENNEKDSIDGESLEFNNENIIKDNSTLIDCHSEMIDESKDFNFNFSVAKDEGKVSKPRIESGKSYAKPKTVDIFGKMGTRKSQKADTMHSEKILNRLERFISGMENESNH